MVKVTTNPAPEIRWKPIEVLELGQLAPLRGHPEAFVITLPIRTTTTGVNYCARVSAVEVVEGWVHLHIGSYAVNKPPRQFLRLGGCPTVFGTAVLFLPKGQDHKPLGFPSVKGTRGDVEIGGKVFTTYFLHTGVIQ